jgi:protocatechuate 3,4-dioxygenase beta subunit
MRTDERGRYEFRSIRPAPYPGGGVPAHVHYVVTARDGDDEQHFELVFDDDPLVSDRVRRQAKEGNFWVVRPIAKDDDGVWRVTADLVLSLGGDT